KAFDPILSQSGASQGLSNVTVESGPELMADGCDALVLVTDWPEFADLDYQAIAAKMHQPVIIDGRNFLDAKALRDMGFQYVGIGHAIA
ncbi:MAG: UDP-glucose/GDP-mannose dehydrogenase family protein, partial [Cyanobacteria bacterium J06639_1]